MAYAFMHKICCRPIANACQQEYCLFIQLSQGAKHEPGTLPRIETTQFL